MTKEKLKLEAIKYLENFNDCANCRNRWGDCADQLDEYCLINGCCFATPKEQDIYLAGAEPREKRIAELEAQIEKMKSQYDYAFNQLCESREIICSMLSQYRDKKEIDYSTRERGEKILKQGVYKND